MNSDGGGGTIWAVVGFISNTANMHFLFQCIFFKQKTAYEILRSDWSS
eukprot:COSAG01_NODE_63165_length_281_cov_0.620879_1_plen_47_part_01